MAAKDLRERSGNVNIKSRLVSFLYGLMRDHLCQGTIEELLQDSLDVETAYTNGYLATYALYVADQLSPNHIGASEAKPLTEDHDPKSTELATHIYTLSEENLRNYIRLVSRNFMSVANAIEIILPATLLTEGTDEEGPTFINEDSLRRCLTTVSSGNVSVSEAVGWIYPAIKAKREVDLRGTKVGTSKPTTFDEEMLRKHLLAVSKGSMSIQQAVEVILPATVNPECVAGVYASTLSEGMLLSYLTSVSNRTMRINDAIRWIYPAIQDRNMALRQEKVKEPAPKQEDPSQGMPVPCFERELITKFLELVRDGAIHKDDAAKWILPATKSSHTFNSNILFEYLTNIRKKTLGVSEVVEKILPEIRNTEALLVSLSGLQEKDPSTPSQADPPKHVDSSLESFLHRELKAIERKVITLEDFLVNIKVKLTEWEKGGMPKGLYGVYRELLDQPRETLKEPSAWTKFDLLYSEAVEVCRTLNLSDPKRNHYPKPIPPKHRL